MDELLAEFIAETRETLSPLASEIVAWEAQPHDRARLDAIFRFVHTVKGSCGFLDLPRLERLAHAAEGALDQVRSGRRPASGALVSAVLAIIDRIGAMVDALDAGVPFEAAGDEALILALESDATADPAPASAAIAGDAAERAQAPAARVARSIRLPVELLDRMMASVSDMVLARNELARRLRETGSHGVLDSAFERLSGCVAEMRDAITRTRMQRIDNLFAALPRMVRDLSAELGKQVALAVDGGDVELDREMIEMIRDPLTHIVRNAIDHGIEHPADRLAAGKPAAGALRVSARQSGNQILIEIADDGRGIDAERLVQKAVAAGLVTPDQGAAMGWNRKLELIFEPGLSTAHAVTAISGRGVGMDVVRANVERIGGLVDIDSRPGLGLRLTLRVPLTLTIIPALTISAGGQDFAIPRSAILEIVRAGADSVRVEALAGVTIASIRGVRLPVVDLAAVLGTARTAQQHTLVVVKPAGSERFALSVDAVHDHEELVVKPAAPAVMATGVYAGTTLPDNGRPMLLLDPAGIAAITAIAGTGEAPAEDAAEEAPRETVPTLLFRGLDGQERAVRLGLVERIEDLPVEHIHFSAGRLRLTHGEQLLPLHGCEAGAPKGERARVLLLGDGTREIAYAIGEVIDIYALAPEFTPAVEPGPIAGATVVDGRQVELIDAFWLFGEGEQAAAPAAARPLCLLGDGSDRWTREVLRPLVEAAGYRVAFGPPGSVPADVTIAMDDGAQAPAAGTLPAGRMIRLRSAPVPRGPGDPSIYRYDRATLVAALDRQARRS